VRLCFIRSICAGCGHRARRSVVWSVAIGSGFAAASAALVLVALVIGHGALLVRRSHGVLPASTSTSTPGRPQRAQRGPSGAAESGVSLPCSTTGEATGGAGADTTVRGASCSPSVASPMNTSPPGSALPASAARGSPLRSVPSRLSSLVSVVAPASTADGAGSCADTIVDGPTFRADVCVTALSARHRATRFAVVASPDGLCQ
jgi:hypothetical protein